MRAVARDRGIFFNSQHARVNAVTRVFFFVRGSIVDSSPVGGDGDSSTAENSRSLGVSARHLSGALGLANLYAADRNTSACAATLASHGLEYPPPMVMTRGTSLATHWS